MRLVGVGTALVTPFRDDESFDENAMKTLIERQIKAGIDFLVPVGTTGESPTLLHDEHFNVVRVTVEATAGRVPVIVGTGSNNTTEAISLTRYAKEIGADGCLVVTPYYNKPTPRGQIEYFTRVADIGLPVVIYNIPSRTGVNVMPDTIAVLAEHPNIIAIKEATSNLVQMTEDMVCCGDQLTYLSGDDALTLPLLGIGGHGVISVASNPAPKLVSDMVHSALTGHWSQARKMNLDLFNFFKAMFLETNPIPVKAAMAAMGLISPVWRSPMTPPEEETLLSISTELKRLGLMVQDDV